jgi:hypothetical protein
LPRSAPEEPSDFEIQPVNAESQLYRSSLWHVTVYSISGIDGVSMISAGLEPTATIALAGPHPEVTVTYHLKKAWFPGRPWSLTVRTEPAGAVIPPMVLVANQRAIPLSAEDGEIVARLPAARDGICHAIQTPINLARCGVRAFADPTVELGSYSPIRVRHPETGATRV